MFVGGALAAYIQRNEPFLNDHVAQEFVSCVIDQELLGPDIRHLGYHISGEYLYCEMHGELGWAQIRLVQGPKDALEMRKNPLEEELGKHHVLLFDLGLVTFCPGDNGPQTLAGVDVLQDDYPINEAKIIEVLIGNLEPNWKAIMYHVNEAPLVFFPEILIAQSNWMVTRRLVRLIYHNPGVRSWLHYTFIVPGLLVFCLGIAVLVRAGRGKAV